MSLIKIKKFPWHSILFSLFPILALAANNINEINIRVVLRPLLISLVVAICLLLVLQFLFKDWQIGGILTTTYLVFFYSYGHVYNLLHNVVIAGVSIGRNRYLAIAWLIISIILTWLIIRNKEGAWKYQLSSTLTLVSSLLVVFQLGSLFMFTYRLNQVEVIDLNSDQASTNSALGTSTAQLPDIYYIILDAYGRSDVLRSPYGIDNTVFIDQLKEMGFYVAQCSTSNYAQTELSLSSSLNYNYLNTLGITDESSGNNAKFISLIKNSAVRRNLENLGYQTVAFATGYQWTEWENADFYYSPQGYWKINEFENLLIRSSAGLLLLDTGLFNIDDASMDNIRARTLFALDKLESLPNGSSPKFVFAHLVIPHIPFVFGPNGEPLLVGPLTTERPYTWEEYKQGYGNQVQFINKRMIEVVHSIIDNSNVPP
ncbi:MAG: hypothetical protein ACK2TS_00760, partial [Anaerolineales bacterium]